MVHAGIILLSAGTFYIDILTPLGAGVWIGYLLPLILVSRYLGFKALLSYTSIFCLFIVAGYFLSPQDGFTRQYVIFSRALDVIVLVCGAYFLDRGRRKSERIVQSVKDKLALRESQEMYRLLFENTVDAVLVGTPEGLIIKCNPAAETMLGYPKAQIEGQSRDRFIAPDNELMQLCINDIIRTGSGRCEITLLRSDGVRFEAEISSSLFTDHDGKTMLIKILRDISERKRLERQKEEMASMMTHDLKSPITAIIGYAELMLMKDSGVSAEDREMLEIIYENGRKLAGMADDYLFAARMESGRVQLRLEPVDLNRLLMKVHKDCLAPAIKKGQECRLEMGPLPEIIADGRQLERAVANLVGNAVNYTQKGGTIVIRGETTYTNGDQWVEISVSDNGTGIPREETARIFDTYYRSERTAGVKGTGLGLSIVKAIAELHKGAVEVESEVGKGSTFKI
ncbi:MAG TPA: PAS domain-containing sensor histidine kinase, partial [Nitrospirota bacterium]